MALSKQERKHQLIIQLSEEELVEEKALCIIVEEILEDELVVSSMHKQIELQLTEEQKLQIKAILGL